MNLDLLPEDCFAHILSFTSPRDACCTSVVSSVVRSLADLDTVWEKFLPSDYPEILSRIVSPMTCSSKKELFLRFREVVELRTICWLQINGKFNTQMLSPRTDYGVYLIFKFADRAHGLDTLPSEVSVQVGNFKTQGKVYLRRQDKSKQAVESVCFLNRMTAPRSRTQGRDGSTSYSSAPCDREDGWTEIELGSFYNQGGANTEVEMGLKEVTGEHLKGGLIVEGIEIRPNS
ncbi:hypothetical protein P3X46_008562 [Hevea brasiliensis]|uniref:F-box domain-containing protein n=1 Tax=Hevea brasiliensis TaxID=3981 RepID=A0ABQ9MMV4_HEVBR|nr:hypothetical protein P3X46_008562 [Hevea brasiliensis]